MRLKDSHNHKVKAFISRLTPFYILPADGAGDSIGFDSYPVEVDQRTVDLAVALRSLKGEMDLMFDNMPAPEERPQDEADFFAAALEEIING